MAEHQPPSAQGVLRGIDMLLRHRPERDSHDFSAVMRNLTAYRDHVIGRIRQKGNPPASLERLSRLNAVISSVYGVHYPIGSPSWALLEKARGAFADVSAALAAAEEE